VVKSALEQAQEAPGSTKGRILAAAEEVFAEKGFQGASTREIAARAGVNISSLHYHWASKETLYFAVFRNIFDRIVDLLQNTLAPLLARSGKRSDAIDLTMGALFDFFADNPNVPKLLLRRVVENEQIDAGIERDILVPAWAVFAEWLGWLGRRAIPEDASRLFMLSMHSVVLVYLLDSRSYQSLLGGSVRSGPLREQVRRHVIELVHRLLVA
jgi:AcrR family transcriptional regulator